MANQESSSAQTPTETPMYEITLLRKGTISLECRRELDISGVRTLAPPTYWFHMGAANHATGQQFDGEFQIPAKSAAEAFGMFPAMQQKAAEYIQGQLRARILRATTGLGIKHLDKRHRRKGG